MQEIEFKNIRVGDTVCVESLEVDVVRTWTFAVTSVQGTQLSWVGGSIYTDSRDVIHLVDRPKREIKVGDRVRRENPEGVTLEFVVHSCSGGYISPKYGADPDQRLPGVVYDGSTFEVVEP